LGFTAILGTLGLVGLAINDSIVVLAALRENPQARQGDVRVTAAVVMHATRHVLATTCTTIIGFIPLILDRNRVLATVGDRDRGGPRGGNPAGPLLHPRRSPVDGPPSAPSAAIPTGADAGDDLRLTAP
jgi:hypothetical protein